MTARPKQGRGGRFRRGERLTARVLGRTIVSQPLSAGLLIAAGLAVSWGIAYGVGGAHVAAPHWFYLPIILAAVRFEPLGALLTSLAAAILAGPLLPLDVDAHTAQPLSDWVTRGAFFVLVGQAFAFAVLYSRQIHVGQLHRVRADHALRNAVRRDEFRIYYQPVVALQGSGPRIIGAEALLRWQHPKYGIVDPEAFIPAAEDTGAIVPITRWLLERVCDHRRTWELVVENTRFSVAVNISATDLESDDLIDHVRQVLALTGVAPRQLALELTETAALSDIERTATRLRALRETGVRVALDDFGTGHASLAHLGRLPVTAVKIDRAFVASITDDHDSAALVESVIQLAHALSMFTVAEGVETREQYESLRAMGCDAAQGFWFSPPLPAEEIVTVLRTGLGPVRRAPGPPGRLVRPDERPG